MPAGMDAKQRQMLEMIDLIGRKGRGAVKENHPQANLDNPGKQPIAALLRSLTGARGAAVPADPYKNVGPAGGQKKDGTMDIQNLLQMLQANKGGQGMQQPPGAYGQPQYAGNAQPGLATGGVSRDVQPGLLQQFQQMMMKKKLAEQQALQAQGRQAADARPDPRIANQQMEQQMRDYISRSMQESMGPGPFAPQGGPPQGAPQGGIPGAPEGGNPNQHQMSPRIIEALRKAGAL